MAIVVSLVSYKFLPARVGGQKGIALFNKYFSQHLRLVCVTTKNNDIQAAEGYEVILLLSNSPLRYINFFYFFPIRRVLKANKATHFLIEHPYFGWLACLLKIFCDIRLIVHSHNIEGLRWRSLGKWWWKILWTYEKFTHRQADYNFFIQQQDFDYAVQHFKLDRSKCMVMTYGIEMKEPPSAGEVESSRKKILASHQIDPAEYILLFNGAFDYKPNLDALNRLVNTINPLIATNRKFRYRLIICGRSIPLEISNNTYPNVVIAGFVDDISLYFKAAHVFLNPILDGGGIKTKLVEALGYNCNAVSTVNGAIGVDPALCNGKLQLVPDNDWNAFAEKVIEASSIRADVNPAYYQHFYWGYTTKKAAEFIQEQHAQS